MEYNLNNFNAHQQLLDRINITNYIPSTDNNGFVTITGESLKLKENIEQFGGKSEQVRFIQDAIKDLSIQKKVKSSQEMRL